jgi:glycosyltransferase involved in cell wall biosynthesis
MQSDFSLTLCICTRNRADDLTRCLESVQSSSRMPEQVIVSDDGDDGKTVEALAASFPFVQYQRGPRIGLGANRNACIAIATGQHLAFIDDDVVIPASYVQAAYDLIQQHANASPTPILSGIEYKHTSAGTILVEPGNADFWGFQRIPPNGVYRSMVINAAIFPVTLFKVALFDSQLRYGSEEIDMARHAVALGYTILFDRSLHVDHYPSEINRAEYAALIDASRMYATAKAYWCYQKRPIKATVFSILAPIKLSIALGRRSGLAGLRSSFRATVTAFQYARRAMRHPV